MQHDKPNTFRRYNYDERLAFASFMNAEENQYHTEAEPYKADLVDPLTPVASTRSNTAEQDVFTQNEVHREANGKDHLHSTLDNITSSQAHTSPPDDEEFEDTEELEPIPPPLFSGSSDKQYSSSNSFAKDNDILDTIIGVVLSFGMAIGVWWYATKPDTTAEQKLITVEQPTVKRTLAQAEVTTNAPVKATELSETAIAPSVVPMQPVIKPPRPEKLVKEVVKKPATINPHGELKLSEKPIKPHKPKKSVPTPKPKVTEQAKPVSPITAAETEQPPKAAVPLPPKVIIREAIEFASGSSELPTSSYKRMDEIAEILAKDARTLTIVGHTDNVGNPETNRRLSLARAISVKKYLVKKGILAEHLKVEGLGDLTPIADNQTEEGRARNRRIEITE